MAAGWSPADVVGQTLDVRVVPDSMGVGGQIVYTVEARLPKAARTVGEPRTLLDDFEVIQVKRYEPTREDQLRIEKTEYLLTAFVVDTFEIEGPSVQYAMEGDTLQLTGPARRVRVVSILDTTASDIRPEKPLIRARINWWLVGFLVISLLVVVGLMIVYGLRQYRQWRDRRFRRILHEPTIVKTPEEVALESLEHLRARRLEEHGYFKEFHVEISNIIRFFIEKKFRIKALEMPTSELMAECRRAGILEDNFLSLLRRFLELCDLVKFAKHPSSPGECRDVYDDAVNLVKLSIASSAMIRFDDTGAYRKPVKQR